MDGKWDGPESVGGAARLSRIGGSGGGVWMGVDGKCDGSESVGGAAHFVEGRWVRWGSVDGWGVRGGPEGGRWGSGGGRGWDGGKRVD